MLGSFGCRLRCVMTLDTAGGSFSVRSVIFQRVRFVVESYVAPLVIETVGGELYLLRLLFALFGDVLSE